jgi:hypothetical protein
MLCYSSVQEQEVVATATVCNAISLQCNAFDELLAGGVMLLLELQASVEGLGLGGVFNPKP